MKLRNEEEKQTEPRVAVALPRQLRESARAAGHREMALARCTPVVSPPLMLLLTLLACASASAAAGWSVCDDANCGKGHCAEVPGIIPTYKCECDPGWSQAIKIFPISPCTIPNCTFDSACFNISLGPPRGIPITDICVAVNCGPGGTCKHGSDGGFSYTCECQPGYVNVFNLTAFPCVKNCYFGMDCSALGLAPPPSPPPASPPPSPALPGSVPLWSLMQLLVSVAMVQVL